VGKCEDDEDGSWDPAILILGAELGGTRVVVGFTRIATSSGCKQACGRGSPPPTSHLIFLFATLITLASRVIFTADGMDMDMVAATFTRA
jgi:hypothetical protein